MKWRLVGALLLAFWPLSTPAIADVRQDGNLIQFSYTWGRVEQTFTDSIVTVTVTNNITNKIGWNGEVIDTYRISIGAEVIEKTEKHDARDYTFIINGTQTLILEGIDRGFWGGFYGPVMQVTSASLQPVTESPSVSPDISESMTAEPQTQSSVSPASGSEVATPSPQPLPSPTPPAPEPSSNPEPSLPQPTPEVTPSPEPTVSLPTESPTLEPTQSPTVPAETPTESEPVIIPASPTPTSSPEQPQPIVSPTPVQSSEPTYEAPTTTSTQASQVTEETESDSVSATIQTAITETIGAAVEAVGELVEAFQSAGLDMTPEQREEAQDVVFSTIIVSQVASAASVTARKIK